MYICPYLWTVNSYENTVTLKVKLKMTKNIFFQMQKKKKNHHQKLFKHLFIYIIRIPKLNGKSGISKEEDGVLCF